MHKTITLLLKNNFNLIIPGFGSLIKSASTGKVSFNEYLKFNDGLFVTAIEKEDGISKIDAEKKIKSFVNEIKEGLSSAKMFTIEGLGEFSSGSKGEIEFKGNSAPSAENPKISPVINAATIIVADKIASTKKEDINEKLAEDKTVKREELTDKLTKEKVKTESAEPKPINESQKSDNPEISKPVTMSSHSNEEKGDDYVHLSQDEIEARHLKRASKGTLIFGTLAIVVIAFFTYINPHHDHAEGEGHGEGEGTEQHEHNGSSHEMKDNATDESSEENAEEAKEEANASSASQSSSASGDPTNPSMESSIPVSHINNKYYIISATFSKAQKAKHQARLLMIMDYKAIVIEPESGKFYACAGASDDYSEAQSILKDYKSKKGDAWLFTK